MQLLCSSCSCCIATTLADAETAVSAETETGSFCFATLTAAQSDIINVFEYAGPHTTNQASGCWLLFVYLPCAIVTCPHVHRLQTAAAAGIAACLLLVMLTAAGAAPAAAPSQPFSTHSITTSTSHTPSASQLQAERIRQLIGDKADTKLSKPPPAREAPQPLTCPSTESTLDPNVDNDLSSVANTTGITYLLPPGVYTISSTISLSTATTCYRGVPGTAQRAADSSAVTILVNPAIGTTGRAFIVGNGAGLVLEYLLLDGQASTGGVQGVNSALETTGVTMQGFRQTAGNSAAEGAAISLEESTVRITGAVFADNAADSVGGAVYLTESNAALEQVQGWRSFSWQRHSERTGQAVACGTGSPVWSWGNLACASSPENFLLAGGCTKLCPSTNGQQQSRLSTCCFAAVGQV
jgi:hypothetical protein